MATVQSKPPQSQQLPAAKLAFQRLVTGWFRENGLDYPWRQTRDPYAILVSELMLQQTQVATVLGKRYFERWLERFPDPATLANANEDDILKAWEGLGYYRRARNLQQAAAVITRDLRGVFPRTATELEALPGVGRYTAGAVATFAFNLPEPIVEANIARMLARLFDFDEAIDLPPGQRQLWSWAKALLPSKNARTYNSGLMELGQQVCTVRFPKCDACPVASFCKTRRPSLLPTKKPRTNTVRLDEHVLYARHAQRGILLRRETEKRREGLWKLPETRAVGPVLLTMPYSITHHRVTLIVHQAVKLPAKPRKNERWVPFNELDAVAMPSPYRRALEKLTAALI